MFGRFGIAFEFTVSIKTIVMKKITLLAMFITTLSVINKTDAQVRFGFNVRIGSPVVAAPVMNNYYGDDYYYYPDIDMYYSIAAQQYVYLDGGRWLFSNAIPYMYRGYNFNEIRRININEARPWLHADVYRDRYAYHENYNRYNNSYDRNVYAHENTYRPAPRYEEHERHENFERMDHFRESNYNHERGRR